MADHHSTLAHASYLDLLRSLEMEAVSGLRGTPTQLVRNGRIYWYDSYRLGDTVKKRYIGEDSDDLRQRLLNRTSQTGTAEVRAANRARLVRILRAEGFLPFAREQGAMISALAAAGTFRLGGTLVGTTAFRLYEGELGVRYGSSQIVQTNDIAQFERLSLALDDKVETSLNDTFREFDFAPVPSLHKASVWRWKQTRSETLVEFLTPSFRAEEDIRPLPALGVSAQSLHYLNYLIAEPIKAVALYRSGVLVQVPRPERYAIHKLIVADRRQGTDRLKSMKDRGQAAFLIEALAEDRPDDLREALEDARARGPRWGQHIDASLARMPATAALLAAL